MPIFIAATVLYAVPMGCSVVACSAHSQSWERVPSSILFLTFHSEHSFGT